MQHPLITRPPARPALAPSATPLRVQSNPIATSGGGPGAVDDSQSPGLPAKNRGLTTPENLQKSQTTPEISFSYLEGFGAQYIRAYGSGVSDMKSFSLLIDELLINCARGVPLHVTFAQTLSIFYGNVETF